jgi:hypothetical protein
MSEMYREDSDRKCMIQRLLLTIIAQTDSPFTGFPEPSYKYSPDLTSQPPGTFQSPENYNKFIAQMCLMNILRSTHCKHYVISPCDTFIANCIAGLADHNQILRIPVNGQRTCSGLSLHIYEVRGPCQQDLYHLP